MVGESTNTVSHVTFFLYFFPLLFFSVLYGFTGSLSREIAAATLFWKPPPSVGRQHLRERAHAKLQFFVPFPKAATLFLGVPIVPTETRQLRFLRNPLTGGKTSEWTGRHFRRVLRTRSSLALATSSSPPFAAPPPTPLFLF